MRPHARAAVCACLLPAALLVIDPSGDSPYGPSKWAAVSVVALAALAVAATGHRLQLARRPLVLWSAFLLWLVVAAAVGLDPVYAWIGSPQRNFGVVTWGLCALMFVAGQSLDDDGDARVVVGTAVVTAGAAGAWAVAEELGWNPTGVAAGSRLIGSMGSAAFLGAAMALLLPTAIGVTLDNSWAPKLRLGAGASATLAAVALIGSGARAAWAGVVLAAVVVAIAHGRRLREGLARRPGAAAAIATAAVAAIVGLGAVTGVAGRIPALFDHSSSGGTSRLDEWAVALRVLGDHPVTGVGPEGYRIALPEGLDAHYVETYGLSPLPDRTHDSLLDVAVTTGFPGLALYAALLVAVAAFLLRALRRPPPWVAGVAVGIVAYLAQELALFPIATLEPGMWLLAGLVVAHTAPTAHLSETAPAPASGGAPRHRLSGEPLAVTVPRPVAAVFAALAVLAAVVGARDVLADRATRASQVALTAGDGPRAQRLAAQARGLRPDQIEYWLAAEQADAAPDTASAITLGLDDLHRALGISPRDPVVRDEQGRLLLERALRAGDARDLAAARADLARLVAADPFDAQDQLRLGVAAIQAGDTAAAERALLAANRLAPSSASAATDLATLYASQGRWPAAAAAAHQALARDPTDAQARGVLTESAPHLGT